MIALDTVLFLLALREDNLKHKEENNHGYPTCDKGYQQVINSRRNIFRSNRHPQVVKSVTNQRYHDPCKEVPHGLIPYVSPAPECDIPL